MPDRNKELSELENRLLSSGFTPTIILRRMIQRDVNITLPKFNMKFDMEMSQIFRKVLWFKKVFRNYQSFMSILKFNDRWEFVTCFQVKRTFPA